MSVPLQVLKLIITSCSLHLTHAQKKFVLTPKSKAGSKMAYSCQPSQPRIMTHSNFQDFCQLTMTTCYPSLPFVKFWQGRVEVFIRCVCMVSLQVRQKRTSLLTQNVRYVSPVPDVECRITLIRCVCACCVFGGGGEQASLKPVCTLSWRCGTPQVPLQLQNVNLTTHLVIVVWI